MKKTLFLVVLSLVAASAYSSPAFARHWHSSKKAKESAKPEAPRYIGKAEIGKSFINAGRTTDDALNLSKQLCADYLAGFYSDELKCAEGYVASEKYEEELAATSISVTKTRKVSVPPKYAKCISRGTRRLSSNNFEAQVTVECVFNSPVYFAPVEDNSRNSSSGIGGIYL